jgi:hypothetical protein
MSIKYEDVSMTYLGIKKLCIGRVAYARRAKGDTFDCYTRRKIEAQEELIKLSKCTTEGMARLFMRKACKRYTSGERKLSQIEVEAVLLTAMT